MRKVKGRLVIDFEVEPSERFKTMRDSDTDKQIRESWCTKIAKAAINCVQTDIVRYIENNIRDDEGDLICDICDDVGLDNDDYDKLGDLVKSFKIYSESKRIKFTDIDMVM